MIMCRVMLTLLLMGSLNIYVESARTNKVAKRFHYPDMPALKNYQNDSTIEATHIKRILAFGDSLTEGVLTGGRKFFPYTTKLEEKLNAYFNSTRFEVLNEGISGECAFVEMVTRLPKVLENISNRVDLIIILAGINDLHKLDCKKRVNVAHEVLNLHRIAHKAGLKSVVVTIPESSNLDESREKIRKTVNGKLKGYAQHHKEMTLLCDLAKKMPMVGLKTFDRNIYWDDEVHPSKIGYEKMAGIIFDTIKIEFSSSKPLPKSQL